MSQVIDCPVCGFNFVVADNSGSAAIRCPSCSRIVIAGTDQLAAADVFLCHSVKDMTVVNEVLDTLERDKLRCWIAPRDIAAGENWAGAIVEAIGRSRMLLIVLSANSNASQQVLREVERAVNRKIPILALQIDEVKLSGDLEYFLSGCYREHVKPGRMKKVARSLPKRVRKLLTNKGDFLGAHKATGKPQKNRLNWDFPNLDRKVYFRGAILAGILLLVGITAIGASRGWTDAFGLRGMLAFGDIPEVVWESNRAAAAEFSVATLRVSYSPRGDGIPRGAFIDFAFAPPGSLLSLSGSLGDDIDWSSLCVAGWQDPQEFATALNEKGFWYSRIDPLTSKRLQGIVWARNERPPLLEISAVTGTTMQGVVNKLDAGGLTGVGCVGASKASYPGQDFGFEKCVLLRLAEAQ